jgi:DNA-binding NtrC family response regulator
LSTQDATGHPPEGTPPETVLIVEPDAGVLGQARYALRRDDRRLRSATTAREGLSILHRSAPDLVVLATDLPDLPAARALQVFLQRGRGVPVIVLASSPSLPGAVDALRSGAQDYLPKPIQPGALRDAADKALQESRTQRALAQAKESTQDRYGFSHMLTRSPLMHQVFDQVAAVAGTDATVLIRGETGTGKELISQAIHERSKRSSQPFIAINCGAFAESLLESELFGHEKGSFTGASGRRKGVFEMADGGTLFLDELGETSLNVQVTLLRVLETMSFRRVGGHEGVRVDVRVIAATNVHLEEAVKAGDFREDLYYRLNVFPISLPPLRARPEDIPILIQHFMEGASRDYGLEPPQISHSALKAIQAWHWPGNVRQLRAMCERWLITRAGQRLELGHLPNEFARASSRAPSLGPDLSGSLAENTAAAMAQLEKSYLHAQLKRSGGQMSEAAKRSGISRRTLYNKVQALGLDPTEYRKRAKEET